MHGVMTLLFLTDEQKSTLRSYTVLKLPIEQLRQFKKHKLHLVHSVGNFDISLTYTQR